MHLHIILPCLHRVSTIILTTVLHVCVSKLYSASFLAFSHKLYITAVILHLSKNSGRRQLRDYLEMERLLCHLLIQSVNHLLPD